jgi:hypothetical protein
MKHIYLIAYIQYSAPETFGPYTSVDDAMKGLKSRYSQYNLSTVIHYSMFTVTAGGILFININSEINNETLQKR